MNRFLLLAAAVAALAPLGRTEDVGSAPPVAWPATWEGRALTPMAPGPGDEWLGRGFPGRVARFSDGGRQVVLRRVTAATRKLHPARDCFAALGYRIEPARMRGVRGGYSSCFDAMRDGRRVRVCEWIVDADARVFSDVSSWYWPALFGRSPGPWTAAMVVERAPS